MSNNKLFITFIYLSLILALFVAPVAGAAKAKNGKPKSKYQYVSDVLVITMRSGKSSEHRIIRTLESGAKLRILESGKKYTKVKTEKGETGWVLTRYLSKDPAARVLLPPVQAELQKLKKEHAELSKSYKAVTKERDSLKHAAMNLERLETEHKQLLEESVRLKDKASKSVNLSEESKELARKNATLESQMDLMLRELKALREGNNRLWFITGAGVILVGIVIGVMIARTRKDKKSSWAASDTLVLR